MQSEKMKEVQPQLEKLEKKYKDKTSEEDQKKKAQEMMVIYKKIKGGFYLSPPKKNPLDGGNGCFLKHKRMW